MNKKSQLVVCASIFLFTLSAFGFTARAAYGPKAFVTEYVSQDYWWNGTAKAADGRYGQAEVAVPNNWDVLQYVRVNTTWGGNTNIQNIFYDNVVTSYPTTYSRDPIYANITGNQQATYYNITNVSAAPTVNFTLTHVNMAGGTDIYDSDNIGAGGSENTLRFNFTIRNPSSDVALNSIEVVLQFTQDTRGTRDAVNITNSTVTVTGGGSGSASDPQGDGDLEKITWTGDLGASGLAYIVFNATLNESTTGNINAGVNSVNLDSNDKGALGNYSTASVFSGLSINYKLSRGPIRQGVDMQISNGFWYVRGLIKNAANDSLTNGQPLTYNITEWRLYSVDPVTGAPYSSYNLSGAFNQTLPGTAELDPSDGTIYTNDNTRSSNTSWWNTTLATGTKPYISSYFDWHVLWNATGADNYLSYINTTMDLQTLYKVDFANTNSITGVIYPDTGSQSLTVRDNVTYTGSDSVGRVYSGASGVVGVGHIIMYSIVPANTSAGLHHGTFNIDNPTVKVYFVNDTNQYELVDDANVDLVVTEPTSNGANGTVFVLIQDLSSASIVGGGTVGKNITDSDEKIMLVFDVITHAGMTTGDTYIFTGNATFNTTSGTSDSEAHADTKSVTVSSKRLTGYKELWVPDPSQRTKVNATINVSVQTGTGEYIAGIKFMDYVPQFIFASNSNLYAGNVTIRFYNGTWNTWTNGTSYRISWNGTTTLSDGASVDIFEIYNATGDGTFNLTNGEIIEVNYQMEIGLSGTYVLPVQIAAFDPSTGESFSAQAFGAIRVDVPSPAVPLQITDHELELAKRVVVGTPAIWVKNFEVFNPNARPISGSFHTTVFGDTMDGFVSYYNEKGEKIEEAVTFGDVVNGRRQMLWSSMLGALETRTYEVRILTPPVVEIDRDVQVLEKLDNKMVKLKMDVFLKSFAEEPYANLVLNLPLSYENIFEVKDGFGKPMQFTGGRDTSSIIVDGIEPSGMKTISVVYKASYPTIIITPDRDRYDLESPVSLEILVINGGETIDYPYMEVEIYTPGMDVIYSNIERLNTIEPLEKTQMYEKFIIPANAPGGMYIASAKFRQDFQVLASTTGNFFVVGPGASTSQTLQIIAVLSVTLVLVYFSLKRLKEVRRTRSLLQTLSVPEESPR